MNENRKNELAVAEEAAVPVLPENTIFSTGGLLFDAGRFAAMSKMAEIMASGVSTVPSHLRGNVGDCFAVIMQAARWNMDPYAVGQKTHLVGQTLGYEAQLVNAVINSLAPTRDRMHYEWFGPWERVIGKFEIRTGKNGNSYQAPAWKPEDEAGCGVRVWATLKNEDEPRTLELLLSQATVRNSTLWASDPKQQLAYLAVKRWSRLYCPEVILGVYTGDELEEKSSEMKNVTPAPGAGVQGLKAALGAGKSPKTKPAPSGGEIVDVPADPVKPAEKLSEKILRIIAERHSPITLADVEKYMVEKKILNGFELDDIERYPKELADRAMNHTEKLVEAVEREVIRDE